jgi:DNA-binding CsgD family transcriptional regulator
VLVGRSREKASIDRLIGAAREGRSGVLVVRGEAGVGKSALLDYALEQASGFTVLRGDGIEVESELAYAALHQILRPAFDRIEGLPEPQAAALRAAFALSNETVDERFRVSLGVLGLLSEVAEDRPLLCLVDDAQWLDQASADALVFAARRVEAESLVLLFAARDEEDRPFAAPGLPELRVSPLSAADSRLLLTAQLGTRVAAGVVSWLADTANGNPLALVELPSNLTADQLAGKEPLVGKLPPATSAEEVYLERVDALPPSARKLLLLAAAEETGARAAIEHAAEEFGMDIADLTSAEEAGLLRVDTERLAFRHPLVRSAIYRRATFTERERAHRALAASLSNPGDEDRRAWHLAAASIGPDEAVAAELETTADRARSRSGYAAAAAALERAAELTPPGETQARRFVKAAAAAWRSGRPERATALLERTSPAATDPRLRADIEHLRGGIELRCGVLVDACDILMRAALEVAPHDAAKALQMLLEAREAAGWAGDTARTVDAGVRVAELPRSDDPANRFLADLVVGVGKIYEGDSAVGTELVQDVIERADGFEVPMWLAWASAGARALGDEAREASLMRRAVSLARASGEVDTLTYVLLGSALMGLLGGRLEAADLAAEGLTLAREAGLPNAMSTHLAMLAWFAGMQGDEENCRACAREAVALARPRGAGAANSIAEWSLAEVDLSQGRAEEAVGHLKNAASAEPGVGHPYFALTSAPDLVEALARAGHAAEAAEAAAAFDGFAQPGAPAWSRALGARCRAITSDGRESVAAFDDALRLHAEAERRFDRARTELLYGEFLRRERRRIDSREHLRAALDEFENVGARTWAERARAELRASGETARRRDPSTLADLTPQELQIARLVSGGAKNREIAAQLFLSPRTIDYHLRKVFMKLGISSRSELIKRGLTETSEDAGAAVAVS